VALPSPAHPRAAATRRPRTAHALRRCRIGFTVLTYNVLAEIYATPDAYPYCASWALPWNYRRRNILRELLSYRADVMCLQEVQADHFENFLEPELAKANYAGVHKCKTREFMGQYGKMDG
jgi:CCR4-NOT transcription complex subunit 6